MICFEFFKISTNYLICQDASAKQFTSKPACCPTYNIPGVRINRDRVQDEV